MQRNSKKGLKSVSILKELRSELKKLAKIQKITSSGEFSTAMSIIEGDNVGEVQKRIQRALKPYLKKGEKIFSRIKEGEIIDSGDPSFRIIDGFVIEFYDYDELSSLFIRCYVLTDEAKTWIGVYIDENPATPWWGELERER